eukprot:6214484-Pleurochrysis_carterae.AAC.3
MCITLQRRLRYPLRHCLARSRTSDTFGDVALTVTKQPAPDTHRLCMPGWFAAVRTMPGASAVREPTTAIHFSYYYSLGAGPDCVVHNTTATQHHELFELKNAVTIL